MKLFCIFLAVLPLSLGAMDLSSVSCKDEKGNTVDWFIIYKFPAGAVNGSSKPFTGEEYVYLVSGHPADKWILSDISIMEDNSMLGVTLNSFYHSLYHNLSTDILYNDQPPPSMYPEIRISEDEEFAGHTKGAVVFDFNQGFWLIHSMPKFPTLNFGYTREALNLAQTIFCMTFGTNSLNDIGKQLILNHPLIYRSHLNPKLKVHLDENVKSLFTNNRKFRKGPAYGEVMLSTKYKNIPVRSFAKTGEFHKDLYSGLIAPKLKVPLFAETWRIEPAVFLPPACSNFHVLDVKSVHLEYQAHGISYSSSKDHSKWAVSQNENSPYVCMGDMDRVLADEIRGGGAACINLPEVWKIFRKTVRETDNCKVDIKHEL